MSEKNGYESPVVDITYFGEDIMTISGGIELPDHDW